MTSTRSAASSLPATSTTRIRPIVRTRARTRPAVPLRPSLLLGYEDVVRCSATRRSVAGGGAANKEAILQRIEAIVGRRPTPGPVRCSASTRPITPHPSSRAAGVHAQGDRAIAALVQGLVDETLERVARNPSIDVIAGLAFPLPFTVISGVGMPDADAGELRPRRTPQKTLDPILTTTTFAPLSSRLKTWTRT